MERLLAEGADVNALDEYGQTPLIYAVDGNAGILAVQALLDAGADVNITTVANWTALDYAYRAGDRAVGVLLMEVGAVNGEGLSRASTIRLMTAELLSPQVIWIMCSLIIWFVLVRLSYANRLRIATRFGAVERDPFGWNPAASWGMEQGRRLMTRIYVWLPLVAAVLIIALGYALNARPARPGLLLILILALASGWMALRRAFKEKRWLWRSIPRDLRSLREIVPVLGEGGHYIIDRGAPSRIRLAHNSDPGRQYQISPVFSQEDITKVDGRLLNEDIEQLVQVTSRINIARDIKLTNVIYAPYAQASEWSGVLNLNQRGIVFAGNPVQLVRHLQNWQLEHAQKLEREQRGKAVEMNAQQTLIHCAPEAWHIMESYVSPDLPGDIDLLIRPDQHTTFVVEIKSHRGDPRAEGDKDWGDVIADVKRQGRLFHKPHLVVWQPIANRQEIISHEGVDFVPGEAGVLLKYIEQRLVQKVAKGD